MVLKCVEHEGCHGLTANPNGETHGIIIPVPVKLMSKPGTYRFVLHFYDDYSDSYKNHQVKAALEVNQQTPPQAAWIWIDGLYGAELQFKVDWDYVGKSLDRVCKYFFTWQLGAGLTAGNVGSVTVEGWNVQYRHLSKVQIDWQYERARSQRVDVRRTVIFTITPHAIISGKQEEVENIARITPTPDHKFPPDKPAVSAINESTIASYTHQIDPEEELYLRSNVVLHELTHLLTDKGKHCRANSPTCVWRARVSSHFYSQIKNQYTIFGKPVSLPWHTLDEVNEMRESLGLSRYKP
ncbi:MAG: hypothetical protein RUDDFDWM_002042 [Candidatus Fervidibacterota bacterium]